MTKCRVLAAGIGSAALLFFWIGLASEGLTRALAWWVTLACSLSAAAYLANWPGIYGKRDGRLVAWRTAATLPFVAAYRAAATIRRLIRTHDNWNEVAPGLFVGGRVSAEELPPGTQQIVDLTSEVPAPADLRAHRGYRGHPVLDGGWPSDEGAFCTLARELAAARGPLYVHCISGRGRAPTAAAAVLLARGTARDVPSAIELVKQGRPATSLTRTDVAFLERIAPRLASDGHGLERAR